MPRLIPRIRKRQQAAGDDGGGIWETLFVAGLVLLFFVVLGGLLFVAFTG